RGSGIGPGATREVPRCPRHFRHVASDPVMGVKRLLRKRWRMTTTDENATPAPASGGLATALGRALSCAPYSGRPAAIKAVVEYTRAGGWVPGDHPWWVEAAGYVYGAVIAIPVTTILYTISWLVQRPTRLLLAGL